VEQLKRLKLDPADFVFLAGNDHSALAFGDWKFVDQFPRYFGCPDGTRSTLFKAKSVIGMGMGEDNVIGFDFVDMMEPGSAAIDHHPLS
jgi:hypothetical protein